MADIACQKNQHSKSSVALMRCVPIAIFTSRNLRETIDFARRDALLTHSHPTCQNANIAYCTAIAHLIECPKDVQGALSKASSTCLTAPGSSEDITTWINGEVADDARSDPGFLKHAFSLAFWHLRQRSTFEEALRDTLMRGGDTDANASIVGGMMGAYHGAEQLPSTLKEPVLACLSPRPRPAAYAACRIPDLVRKLYNY
jgi:ADP-ribosylglycohydrolase